MYELPSDNPNVRRWFQPSQSWIDEVLFGVPMPEWEKEFYDTSRHQQRSVEMFAGRECKVCGAPAVCLSISEMAGKFSGGFFCDKHKGD